MWHARSRSVKEAVMVTHRFPAAPVLVRPASPPRSVPTTAPAWLLGLWAVLQAPLRWLRSLAPVSRAATIPIAVLCDGADPAAQHRYRQALRAGLRQAEHALAG